MRKPPLPPQLDEVLSKPNPSVIATAAPDGAPVTVATWYVWENGRVLVSMDDSRARLEHIRNDPRVSLTVLNGDSWYQSIGLRGHVVSLEDDAGLADIDRISTHYRGRPYPARDRSRTSAWIEVLSWHQWGFDGAG
jgi:PPOX class probable F420-dependent enzyme